MDVDMLLMSKWNGRCKVIYDLVDQYDPILRQPTQSFDFENIPSIRRKGTMFPLDPEQLAADLKETMIHCKGAGLAAPQVGIPYSVCVVGHHSQPDEIMTLFNPRIVDFSGEEYYSEEGCLTFPGLFIKVKRHMNIRLRCQLENGVTDTITLDGWAARVVQHEVDHLNGILYQDRATRYHLDQGRKQKVKLDRMRKKNGTATRQAVA